MMNTRFICYECCWVYVGYDNSWIEWW